MAKKSEEEIIKKPTASRGRPRKDAQASKTKKSSKSKTKKKTTKKSSSSKKSVSKKIKSTTLEKQENVELINDVQIENNIPDIAILNEVVIDEIIETETIEPVQSELSLELDIQEDSTEEIEIIADENILDVQKIEEEIVEEGNLEVQEPILETPISPVIDENEIIEKTKKKRTIRNISIKRSSVVTEENSISESTIEKQEIEEKPIEEKTIEEVVIQEKIIELPVREKRTLRLNLGSKKQETIAEPAYKKDESINQNSAFFNEPSIFAKFNIDITNTENEEQIENTNEIIEEPSTSEEEISEIIENKEIENTENITNELSPEQLDELICDSIANTILEEPLPASEENQTSEDLIDEIIEQAILEEISQDFSDEIIEEETANSEILQSVRSILGGKLGSLEELETQENIDDTIEEIIEDEQFSENAIQENDIADYLESSQETETTDYLEIAQENEVELNVAAETISPVEPIPEKTSDNSPIGKFFDSSIPSMTSSINNTFSKIKKSIFSNVSPIFKKFTFEEATLRTHQDELKNNYNEPENNLSDIQKALENFTPNVQLANNINEMDIQAEPILSVPVIEKNVIVSANQDELVYENPELNIITPLSDTSIDEDLIELEDFEINNELDEIETTNKIETVEELIETENIDTSDIIEEIENLDTEELNINDLENLEEEYNDEEFSIESYFGIDNVTLEENDLKSLNTIPEQIKEESIEVNTSTSTPEEFVNKFLETNSISENQEDLEIEEEIFNEELDEIQEQDIKNEISNEEIVTESTILEESAIENQEDTEKTELEKALKEKEEELSSLSKLLESFTQTISTLTNRITDLENKQIIEKEIKETISENNGNEELSSEIIENLIEESQTETEETTIISNPEETNAYSEELNVDDIDIEDLDLNDLDLEGFEISEENEEPSLLSQEENTILENQDEGKNVESILSEVLLSKDLDENLKEELLSEVLSYEDNLSTEDFDESLLEAALLEELSDEDLLDLESKEQTITDDQEPLSDFSKIIESLTKAITELEQAPDIKQETKKTNDTPLAQLPAELTNYSGSEDKAINILINKDDIFSISILNETYEIVADFDGISVLSENLHISTPKNNFFVKVGNKYIEIHNKKDNFILNTNFEDIEFANAINNIAFAKKNNKIELNIKEAFKLSSVNNKIELSMLNKAIADLSTTSQSTEPKDDSSICDNKTLLISEETQKVYLPYTIEDVMKKLKSNEEYQTVQEVVDNEYTLPLSTFKMPIISRFKEAYRFMRTKENSSVYAAVDLALELMFNSNLNPAVIRAAKDMKELNIYLDCLYENEVEKFDCFKIVYKVLPKIK